MVVKINKKFVECMLLLLLQVLLVCYVVFLVECDVWLCVIVLNFLYVFCVEVRQCLQVLKCICWVQIYDDLIDGVVLVLEGLQWLVLVKQLCVQYCIVLVDEFQDIDDCQWGIFYIVFGDLLEVCEFGLVLVLFLIGDFKQVIYGFRGGDIYIYLKVKWVV